MNAAAPATAFRVADRISAISAIGVSDIVRISQAANALLDFSRSR